MLPGTGVQSVTFAGTTNYGPIDTNQGVVAASLQDIGNVIGTQNITFHPKPIRRRETTLETIAKVLDWLCPLHIAETLSAPAQDRKARNVHPEAGKAFSESSQFNRWLAREEQRLWCVGAPGVGKTFLVSQVHDRLRRLNKEFNDEGGKSSIAFLYLKYYSNINERDLLGCIIRQLVEDQDPLPVKVKQQWANYAPTVLADQQLVDLLQTVTVDRQVYVVVDAMDECPAPSQKLLVQALLSLCSKVQLMFTSRPMTGFEQLFKGFCRISITADPKEIRDYVDHCIDGNPRLRDFCSRDKGLQSVIRDTIQKKSQDLFLLVRLQMESLEAVDLLSDLKKTLYHMSDEIYGVYDGIIERIQRQLPNRRDLAMKTLAWVAYASRPLTVSELQHILAVNVDDTTFDPEKMPCIDDIIEFCCGIVIIQAQSDSARLVHFTAKTYMMNLHKHDERFNRFHTTMANVCAVYLKFPELEEPDDPIRCISYATDLHDDPDNYDEHHIFEIQRNGGVTRSPDNRRQKLSFWTKLRAYPFASYAGPSLGYHLRAMENQPSKNTASVIKAAASVIAERSKRNFYRRLLFEAESYPNHQGSFRSFVDSFTNSVDDTSEDEFDFDQEEFLNRYQPATELSDHDEETCSSDFDATSNPDDQGPHSERSRETDEFNADDKRQGGGESESGQYSPEKFEELYPDGLRMFDDKLSVSAISISTRAEKEKEEHETTPLHLAANTGSTLLVQTFLHSSTSLNTQDEYGYTPLAIALDSGHFDVANQLLHAGATVDIESTLGGHILLFVAQSTDGHHSLINDFLNQAMGMSMLHKIMNSHEGRIYGIIYWLCAWLYMWLYEWPANLVSVYILAQNSLRSTHIHQIRNQTILANTVRLNRDQDQTQDQHLEVLFDYIRLMRAAFHGDCASVTRLIHQNNISGSFTEERNLTHLVRVAFFLAVENQHTDVLELFINHNVNIDTKDYHGRTALHRAVARRDATMVKLLLDHGATIDARDRWRNTPWILAARSHYEEICGILVKRGAKVNKKADQGVNPLYDAACNGAADEVKFLLNQHVDPSIVTDFGWAPLHWAAHNGNLECVRLLLEFKAAVNPISDQFKTPLDMVIGKDDHSEIEKMLREAGAKTTATIMDEASRKEKADID